MYIKVTVFPDFKKELIENLGVIDGHQNFKMYIREAPERGQANKKILKILQEIYPNKKIRIVTGALTMKKLIEVK